MAVALRGAAVVPAGNPTTGFTLVIPAQVVAGDLLLLPLTSRDSVDAGTLSVTDNDTGGNTWAKNTVGGTDHKATLWSKIATANTAGKTITVAGAVGSCAGVLKCFSGADPTSPVTNTSVETNASGDETHAGFTPDNADSMLCAVIFNGANDNAVTNLSFATAGATAMTEKLSTGGSDCACAFGHVLQSGGPSATGNLTWAQTNGAGRSLVFAIKPEAAVNVDAPVTGVAATGAVGSAAVAGDANVAVTGVSATGAVGTVTATGTSPDVVVEVTGVSATGAVGSPAVTADANTAATGVSATGAVGAPAVSGDANVEAIGVSSTGAAGSPAISGDANTAATGVSATGEVGTSAVTADANTAATGVQATGLVGTVAVATGDVVNATAEVTGVQATGAVGTAEATGSADVAVSGVQAAGEVGTVNAFSDDPVSVNVTVTGVQAVGHVGFVGVQAGPELVPYEKIPGNWFHKWGPVIRARARRLLVQAGVSEWLLGTPAQPVQKLDVVLTPPPPLPRPAVAPTPETPAPPLPAAPVPTMPEAWGKVFDRHPPLVIKLPEDPIPVAVPESVVLSESSVDAAVMARVQITSHNRLKSTKDKKQAEEQQRRDDEIMALAILLDDDDG